MRIRAQTKKPDPNGHWIPEDYDNIDEPRWYAIPPLPIDLFERHLQSNGTFAACPGFWRMAIVDVDKGCPETTIAYLSTPPIHRCQTPRGHHLFYATHGADAMKNWSARTGRVTDDETGDLIWEGEIPAIRRYAKIHSPNDFLTAANMRAMETHPIIDLPTKLNVGYAEPKKSLLIGFVASENAEEIDSQVEKIAAHYGMRKNGGRYVGGCPLCGEGDSATRFQVTAGYYKPLLICRSCSPEGLAPEDEANLLTECGLGKETPSVLTPPNTEEIPPFMKWGDVSDAVATLATAPDDVQWLIPGVIPMSALTIMSSAGGSGKSTLMAYVCLAMMQRREAETQISIIGDWKLNPLGHDTSSLFISYEDNAQRLAKRYRTFYNVHRDKLTSPIARFKHQYMSPENPLFASWHNIEKPGFTEFGDAFLDYFEKTPKEGDKNPFPHGIPPKLVVIDPIASAFGGNENDRREVRQFVGRLDRLALETETAIVLIAHPPKSGSSYSGSTDWVNAARSMFTMKPLKQQAMQSKGGEDGYWPKEITDKFDERTLNTVSRITKRAQEKEIRAKCSYIEVEKLNDGYPADPIAVVMGEWDYPDENGEMVQGYGLRGIHDFYTGEF